MNDSRPKLRLVQTQWIDNGGRPPIYLAMSILGEVEGEKAR
jgi:hypothetical protein